MKQLRTLVIIFLLSISAGTMSACSVWDMVKPSKGLAVDTELVIGDKKTDIQTEIGGTTNTADSITIQNVDKTPGFFWSILFVLGWLLPEPPIPWGKIWRGLTSVIRR